jgi:hypothetical protein
VEGLYPNDTWSGRRVSYERLHCSGGSLTVRLGSDPKLFREVQTVVARSGGGVIGAARVAPAREASLTVPLRPGPDGRCIVRYEVARTLVPALVIRGSADPRRLGAHFLGFTYRP